MRRGITPVVAIALLLGMTVVASGGAYAFFTTATESAMADTTASLQTSTDVRDIRCSDTSVTVAISNTGDRGLATDAATAYLYQGGELRDTVEKDLSGADVLQPGGFSQIEFPFTTYLSPGTGYGVEVSFENTGHSIERNCQADNGDLVGYWNFDSISSRSILDAAGDNDGTFYGMDLNGTFSGMLYNGTLGGGAGSQGSDPTWTGSCQTGDCLDFDGTDDYIDIGNVQGLAKGDNARTFCAWTYTDSQSRYQVINYGASGSENSVFDLEINAYTSGDADNAYGLHLWQNYAHIGEDTVIYDEWVHLCVSHSGGNVNNQNTDFYVNGEQYDFIGSPDVAINTGSSELNLGVDPDNNNDPYMNGKIDDVHVYNRSLSSSEITSVMNGELVTDSLIANYPMDEGSGQTVYNNAFHVEGQHGQAARFDGIDDCIDLPDVLPSSSPKSAGGWFKLNEVDESERILALRGSAKILLVAGDSSNGALDIWQSGWHRGLGTIAADTWTHLFMTDDGSTVQLYKNGEEIASFSSSPGIGNTGDSIGCDWGGIGNGWAYYTNGSIDDIRVYDRALSQSEVQEAMNGDAPQEGIVAYYSMDGSISNNAFWREGKDGGALTFDGSDDWVRVPDSSELNPTRISYGAWFKPDTIEVGQVIKKCCVSGSSIWIRLNPGGNVSAGSRIDGTFQSVLAESVATAGEWTHAFYTYNGSTARLYIDGELAGETPATGDVDSTTGEAVTIGSSQGGGNYFPGTIEDVRIYSSALTQEQVTALYNATN